MTQSMLRPLRMGPATLAVVTLHAGLVVALLAALDRGMSSPPPKYVDAFNVPEPRGLPTRVLELGRIDLVSPAPDPKLPEQPRYDDRGDQERTHIESPEQPPTGTLTAVDPVWLHPRILIRTEIAYPWRAKLLDEEGVVELAIRIGVDGSPREIRVARSSGHQELDAAARASVARWKFEPLMRDGVPMEAWARLPIAFRLED
jgi:protein TonB